MNSTVVILLLVTGVIALVDWYAVARDKHPIELVAKPLTLVALMVAAGFADLGDAKPWVMAALAFGLIGDVALMFSPAEGTDELDPTFLVGLGSFLLGHFAYYGAFTQHGLHGVQAAAGALVAAGATSLAIPRVLRGAKAQGGTVLAVVVSVYATALGVMVVLAFGTAAICTAIGGAIFLVSDTTIAWNRFVQPLQRGPLIIIVTYHVAQVLILLGLAR